jgi:hypothetical protein
LNITVNIPAHVEEHLRSYAASLFYDTSEYAMSRAMLVALVSKLDELCLISPEDVVAGVMKGVEVPQSTLQQGFVPYIPDALSVEKEYALQLAMVGGTPPEKKPIVAKPKNPTVTDPKDLDLRPISEEHGGKPSYTWLVWGWAMGSTLNEVTTYSGARQWHCFDYKTMVAGVHLRKGVSIKETTAYAALDTLVKYNWLTMNDKRDFSLTQAAQKWALKKSNQDYLIEHGFLDPIDTTPVGK